MSREIFRYIARSDRLSQKNRKSSESVLQFKIKVLFSIVFLYEALFLMFFPRVYKERF